MNQEIISDYRIARYKEIEGNLKINVGLQYMCYN